MNKTEHGSTGVLPPFALRVIEKLQRFFDCAEDFESGGVDIGRDWLDTLTHLGLLERVQRSPALWQTTEDGDALLASAPAQPAAQDQGGLPPLGESMRSILGRPNFACAGIARQLRALGHAIPHKAEEEQAAVIYWLLGIFLKHGEDWASHANAALAASTGQEV